VGLKEPVVIQIFAESRLVYYEQIVDEECLMVNIDRNRYDTLIIFLKTESQAAREMIAPDSGSSFSISAKLTAVPKNMEEIFIKPTGYTKKGDTTSYLVDFYAQSNHQVLKDILNNIPYLTQEDDGSITYKGKKISSIKIQGEEIFSDQLRLLANHIPIHILKSIELIEHNPSHSLLKGLQNSSDVVMNLSVKEKYKGKLWGTLSSGYGNDKRFEFSPVIFSLRQKMKIGLIGNSYSGGNAADKAEQLQIKTPNLLLLQQITGQSPALLIPIANTDRYFSRNNLSDHRIQITHALNDDSKLTAEGRYINNRSFQQTDYAIARISDSLIKRQEWVSAKNWKPVHLSFKLKYIWENQKNHLSLSLNWQKEQDQPEENSRFTEQATSFFYVHNLRQAYETKSAETNWIQKTGNSEARKLSARIENTLFNGNSMHVLPLDFGFPLNGADNNSRLTQLSKINLTSIQAQYEKFAASKSNWIQPIQWNIDWKQLQICTNLTAYDTSSMEQPIPLSKYSGTGNFGAGRISAEIKTIKKKKKGVQKYFIQLGAGFFLLNENNFFTNIAIRPIFQIHRETERAIPKYGIFSTSLQFSEGESDILKLNRILIPNQGLNYTSYSRPVLQNRTLLVSFSFRGSAGKRVLPQSELSTFTQFYSPVFKTMVSGPLTETFVQMIPKPTSVISLANQLQWLAGDQLPVIKTSIRLGFQENFFLTGNKIIKFKNGFFQAEITADWQTLPTLRLSISGKLDYRFFPNNQFKEQIPVAKNFIFRKNIKLSWQVTEKACFEYSGMVNANNFRKWTLSKTIFSEASFKWKLNKTLNLYFDVYNLFNLSNFSLSDQNLSYLQSRLSIPLMPRHFLAGIKWIF
jgi:hypothetical protein